MNDLTIGNPTKVLLKLTIPMFLSVIFQQMYNMADSIIAGNFAGENALAAIGASYPITMLFMAVAFGCNIGCSVIISRLFGEKNYSDMKCCISTTMISVSVLSVIMLVAGRAFSSDMMRVIHTPQNIFSDAEIYLNIYFYGLPFLFIYNIVTGVFTSLGDSKTPLYFLIASSVANIILDYIFVAWCGWGVAGVAWATFIAQGLAGILSAVRLYFVVKSIKVDNYRLFSWSMLSRISKMAVPSIMQQSCISIGNILVQSVINPFGAPIIAGYATAIKLNTFAITTFVNFGNGISAFTAQNLGAKKLKRIDEGFYAVLKIVYVMAVPFFIMYFFFGEFFVGLFLKDPTKLALDTGTLMLKMFAPFYITIVLKVVVDNVLRGVGNMKAFIMSAFIDLLLRVVFSYILAPVAGINGVFYATMIGWAVGATVAVLLYIRQKKHITDLVI